MTPAPSPSRLSAPTAPRWVILHNRLRAAELAYSERSGRSTICDNFVANLAFDMAERLAKCRNSSAGEAEGGKNEGRENTKRSLHRKHPFQALDHIDPALEG